MATIVTLNDTATSSNQGKSGDTLQIQNPAGGLLGTNKVSFGTKTVTTGLTVTATQVSCTIPTGLCAGQVAVSVVNTSNVTSNTLPFYIIAKPSVSGLSVTSGAIGAGATTLNIFGSGFTTATGVAFGTDAATINTITDSVLNVTAPTAAHTMVNGCVDTVNVVVTGFGGSSTPVSNLAQYAFCNTPAITSLSSASGTADDTINVNGTCFVDVASVTYTDSAAATFSASFTPQGQTLVTTTVPTGMALGAGTITVTTPGGNSNAQAFTVT